jgi:2'-5' RNA ligase
MLIKNYGQFINESSEYQWGCVMVDVPVSNWDEITSYIDPEDVYTGDDDTHGIQENPHLTLLYPVLESVKFDEIKNVLKSVLDREIFIEIDNIDVFENEEFDVVKFNVKNNEYLNKIHNKLKNNIPNKDKFDIYRPHITIAYIKKGIGKKYKKNYNHSISLKKITYTKPDGTKEYYNI